MARKTTPTGEQLRAQRARIAASLLDLAEAQIRQAGGEYTVFAFCPDGHYAEATLPLPPAAEQRHLTAAASTALQRHVDLCRYDSEDPQGLSAVDQWLRGMLGGE